MLSDAAEAGSFPTAGSVGARSGPDPRLKHVPGWVRHQNQTWHDWPTAYGPPADDISFPIRTYNSSVIRLLGAARSIFRRCVYVAAIRAYTWKKANRGDKRDAWHDPSHGTIIAVLDSSLSNLAWTWLIASPDRNLKNLQSPDRFGRWNWNRTLPLNVSDGFQPSWGESAYDTRLLNVGDAAGTILFTHHTRRFKVMHLMLTADTTQSGGLKHLRVWSADRSPVTLDAYANGRDQALFALGSAGGEPRLFVQPWIGLIAMYGRIFTRSSNVQCDRQRVCLLDSCPCGPHSEGRFNVKQIRYQHALRLVANETDSLLRQLDLGGLRLSPTANLIHISCPLTRRRWACPSWVRGGCKCRRASRTSCGFLLEIGHIHRSDTRENLRNWGASRRLNHATEAHRLALGLGPHMFAFGAHYTHFLYAVQPCAPYAVVAVSEEFCLEARGATGDCETIQFVSGLEHLAGTSQASAHPAAGLEWQHRLAGQELLLSYGINDCEAKVGKLQVDSVLSMFEPVALSQATAGRPSE
jgi:hypothetical protein